MSRSCRSRVAIQPQTQRGIVDPMFAMQAAAEAFKNRAQRQLRAVRISSGRPDQVGGLHRHKFAVRPKSYMLRDAQMSALRGVANTVTNPNHGYFARQR